MLKKELLKILACPACRGKVEYDDENETINCTECKRCYPVRNGIPVMLIEESKVLNNA